MLHHAAAFKICERSLFSQGSWFRAQCPGFRAEAGAVSGGCAEASDVSGAVGWEKTTTRHN
eukprot:634651-Rhodomonas_salina.1